MVSMRGSGSGIVEVEVEMEVEVLRFDPFLVSSFPQREPQT
jgi:hypothetical protein